MTSPNKKKGQWLRRAGAAIIIVAIVALLWGAYYYIGSMRKSLWTQSVSDVLEITEQGAHSFEVYVSQGFTMLEGRASNFAQYESSDEKSISAKLDLYEEGDPTFVVMDLTHGILYFNSTSRIALSEEEIAGYLDLPGRGVLEPYLNEYTGQRMFGYYERFTFADGAKGLVRKDYLLTEVAEEFSLSFFDDTGFSYVVSSDGDIVLRPNNPNSNRTFSNVFDVIKMEENTQADEDAFRSGINSGKRGAMRLMFDEKECVFTFTPIADTDGWYVISIIPSNSITTRTEQLLKTSETFLLVIGIALFIFLLFAVMVLQYRRNIRKTESELKYREQLFGILANGTDEAFLMLSGDGLVTEYASPNIERVTGISRQEALSDGLSFLTATVQGAQQYARDEELRSIPLGKSLIREEKRILKGSEEERWMEERIYHLSINGSEKFIVVFSDRTEDRKKEYALTEALGIAQEANQSKSKFLSNMSHDIRTPMNAIVGLSALLQRDAKDPDKVLEHTRKITASSQHLLGLINDVLDMSKIEGGKTAINTGEISLVEIVEELETIMLPQAKDKKQKFEVHVNNLTDEYVLGDKLRINQVLINILSNAIKYTPEGGRIELTVRQIPYEVKGFAHFRFQVGDNGIGIDNKYLESIFDPFSRADDSPASGIQGTGLGMAITKNLVELMGGSITVKSKLGKGSLFTVDLELQVSERQPEADCHAKSHNQKSSSANVEERATVLKGKHFLVAEDNELNAEILAELLSMMEADCEITVNGKAVLERFEASIPGEFDAILMDIQMPVMNGYEASRAIRTCAHPLARTIPIVAMTANAFTDDVVQALSAGMNAHIAKPVDMDKLEESLKKLL